VCVHVCVRVCVRVYVCVRTCTVHVCALVMHAAFRTKRKGRVSVL